MHLNMCHSNQGWTQNVSQLALTKTQFMQPNTKNASQTHPLPVSTQNALTNPFP
jgi:hypothetical protein